MKFKVGDKVKIVAANCNQDRTLIGGIYTVDTARKNCTYGLNDRFGFIWMEDELELVCKPKFNHEDYPDKYVMHVNTIEEAEIFVEYMKKHMNGRWADSCFDAYKSKTCYNFNLDTFSSKEYYKRNSYTILEFEDFDWSDFTMEKKFTKADLKNGDIILRRDGAVEIVIVDSGIIINRDHGSYRLQDVYTDLTSSVGRDRDIVAVRRPKNFDDFDFSMSKGELVYERKEVEEMTLEEVCKALGKEIKIVKK